MNRAELQQLARERMHDAKALLTARRWSGAYYLAGYAVECGLKSCIIRYLMNTDQFPDRRYSELCWTHNLVQLVALAGLKDILEVERTAEAEFRDNWDVVRDWSESRRYTRTPKPDAQALYNAIADSRHGVMSWISRYW